MAQTDISSGSNYRNHVRLAQSLLRTARQERWWSIIDDRNVNYRSSWDRAHTKTNLLLGRIALREGDRAAAKDHLLGAIKAGTENWLSGWDHMDLDLPAELLAAGESAAVLRFVDQAKKAEADYKTGAGWADIYWADDTIYELEASDRTAAVDLDQLRKDVSAGKVPDYWKKELNPPPQPTAAATLKPLPSPQGPSTFSRQIGFLLSQLQYPVYFQMAGWVLAVPILYRRPRAFGGLSFRTASWFSAIGALSLVEGILLLALFWSVFGFALRVVFQAVWFQAILALAAAVALWEIRRALRGETTAGRMTLLLRGSLAYLAVFFCLKSTLTNRHGIAPDFVYFMSVFVTPLLGVTSGGIVLGVAWELWQWTKRNASLPSWSKWCLYVAAPILGAQVVAGSWPYLAGMHIISRPLAISLLWLNVLLPWLVLGGFAAARQPAEPPVPSPTAAKP